MMIVTVMTRPLMFFRHDIDMIHDEEEEEKIQMQSKNTCKVQIHARYKYMQGTNTRPLLFFRHDIDMIRIRFPVIVAVLQFWIILF